MKNTKTILALAVAVVLLPGVLAACSGAPSSDSTGPASGADDSGTSLSSCMRGKGYDIPDPGSGMHTLTPPEGVDEEQWDVDLQKCMGDARGAGEGFEPAKPMGSPEQLTQVSECIRENGFSDYPDDEAGQTSYTPDDQDAFQDAAMKCYDDVLGSGDSEDSK